ncbi:o-succinylbenzoate synthase [Bacillus luteolus]|uniref:o-succinylbenzoate synthase n=1 Tax=Litchfieldia luteola TaxID=682179 RepID=A0ABR9QIS4_9BACI|nr:o-succinylbenzoate synthase [Cytobacillus luteolus]MBE4908404.1 o-succinylbenzoate synthase [Cytobacillus luteolus]MBP1943192.1 O-succinylbenzoate synthase [Cytobacillus luteolus]
MKVKKVTLHLVGMKLVSPFKSSLEVVSSRESILVEVQDDDGIIGWGEVVAFSSPWYTEETIKTCWHVIEDFLIPKLLKTEISHPDELEYLFQGIKRNHMAKAGVELAIWDLYAKNHSQPLASVLGGTRKKIEAGVVIGIESIESMLNKIAIYVDEGYKRFKIKIEPGKDVEIVNTIRQHFPHLPLMADANSAYTLDDINKLRELDHYNLMMIEQPLGSDDIFDHSKLQKELNTPICLDESIVSFENARKAIELGSCKIINIKAGRVGGLQEAKKIHDLCMRHNIPVWCGGMLETGISRAHNIALASLPNFTIPGDISASSRYWERDIITPEVSIKEGLIEVPTDPGIGFEINREMISKHLMHSRIYC